MIYIANSRVFTFKKPLAKRSWHIDFWLVAVLISFALLAWASWGKLEYPIIDVGHEVDPPPRILKGQILYRDIESYYGPLAYYVNAGALLLFGHHLEVFYAVGLLLALAATLLFYKLAKRLMNAPWAALCTVCMLIYCALGASIFHFVVPYSYGAVYAIVFCLLAFTFLDYYACGGGLRWLIVAAIACGLAGLAKQEYGVAALGGVLVGLNLSSQQKLKTRIFHSLLVLTIAGTTTLLPLSLLAQQASWQQLGRSLLPVSKSQILIDSGMFDVSLAKTLGIWWRGFKAFVPVSLAVVGATLLAHWFSKFGWRKSNLFKNLFELLISVVLSLVFITALNKLPFFIYYSPLEFLQPLSDLSWSLPLLLSWFIVTKPKLPQFKHPSLLWTLLIFSVLLNSRWLLHIHFYGLYAVSVILLFFTFLFHVTQKNRLLVWRYLLICLLIAGLIKVSECTAYRYAVHSSYGTFYTKDIALASAFNQTIDAINISKASSVLVLPQGNILNFLTATQSPSKETNFIPGVFPTPKDEQDFIGRMQKKPSTLIVYVNVPFYSLKPSYDTFAEVNPVIHEWITKKHQLIKSFPMSSQFPWHQGVIEIYARNRN